MTFRSSGTLPAIGVKPFLEQVGYTKFESKWGIVIRRVGIRESATALGAPQHELENIWSFHDAPRELRLEAIEKLPDLVMQIQTELTTMFEKVRSKAEKAQRLVDALSSASEERKGPIGRGNLKSEQVANMVRILKIHDPQLAHILTFYSSYWDLENGILKIFFPLDYAEHRERFQQAPKKLLVDAARQSLNGQVTQVLAYPELPKEWAGVMGEPQ